MNQQYAGSAQKMMTAAVDEGSGRSASSRGHGDFDQFEEKKSMEAYETTARHSFRNHFSPGRVMRVKMAPEEPMSPDAEETGYVWENTEPDAGQSQDYHVEGAQSAEITQDAGSQSEEEDDESDEETIVI